MTREIAVAVYLLALILVWRARPLRRAPAFWKVTMLTIGLLAIDRQFALLDRVTDMVRGLAEAGQWYDRRETPQREAAIGILLGAALLMAGLLILLRRATWPIRAVALATSALLALALLKAISLHGLDAMLGLRLVPGLPLSLSAGIELACLAIIIAGAALAVRRRDAGARRS
ncbi:hypothetical protein [Sphingobium nicotianae]|uniref:Uncharacterized protein n=1 Tax=Sphingobium nicotianae TaxID=2782607 RepID=A0A9X1DFI2_9SPHN|nr:hypothetical protein [Sphingobium nicotianae]MBT2188903.1 hypothetical protein [Sphingobium nicotianae]